MLSMIVRLLDFSKAASVQLISLDTTFKRTLCTKNVRVQPERHFKSPFPRWVDRRHMSMEYEYHFASKLLMTITIYLFRIKKQ